MWPPRLLLSCACAVVAAWGAARAQTAAPLLEPKPVFTPGMYEIEASLSPLKVQPDKRQTCIASADYDAFRDEMMAHYQNVPQFQNVCRLGDTKALKNGFAFAMQCKGGKTIFSFEFDKDLVRLTGQSLIEDAPQNSSSILIMMRRIGDCPDQAGAKPK